MLRYITELLDNGPRTRTKDVFRLNEELSAGQMRETVKNYRKLAANLIFFQFMRPLFAVEVTASGHLQRW